MRKVLLIALIAIMLSSLFAGELFTKAPAEDKSIIPLVRAPKLNTNTQYYINPKSNVDMQVDIDRDRALGKVKLWPFNSSFAQRFFFTATSHGKYNIVKAKHLTFMNTMVYESVVIPVMSEDNNSPSALWHIIPSGEADYYYIINDADGKAFSINSENQNSEIVLDILTGAESQKWRMILVHNK